MTGRKARIESKNAWRAEGVICEGMMATRATFPSRPYGTDDNAAETTYSLIPILLQGRSIFVLSPPTTTRVIAGATTSYISPTVQLSARGHDHGRGARFGDLWAGRGLDCGGDGGGIIGEASGDRGSCDWGYGCEDACDGRESRGGSSWEGYKSSLNESNGGEGTGAGAGAGAGAEPKARARSKSG
ncbi:hypothetical protein EI94DRAFT_1734303 [Lactarius quietus]|nr:hypothetical protein EI94DRAFT_1734303 [Lactarius quietus]